MTRHPTPNLLADQDVSQETDLVRLALGSTPGQIYGGRTEGQRIHASLDLIVDNPYQPRQHYTGIEELAENIRLNGLLQIPFAREKHGRYQLAFGHRRLRAFRLLNEQLPNAGWNAMPLIMHPITDDEMARFAWSENHNREDVSPVEEARLFARMIDEFGFTQQEIADDLGKSRSAVANTLRLLQLPQGAQELIDQGKITERHGRELLRLADAPHWQQFWLDQLIDDLRRQNVRTVADLKRNIDDYILRSGTRLPRETVKAKDGYGVERTIFPPAWPFTGFAPKSPEVVGDCNGCSFLVCFGVDPIPVCTKGTCLQKKKELWAERDRERQRAAALAAANTTAPAGTPERKAGDPPARTLDKLNPGHYGVYIFRAGNETAPPGLIEHGLCGKDQCPCFTLVKLDKSDNHDGCVFPDRTAAPDVVYGCENANTLVGRRRRLQAIVDAEAAFAENQRRAAQATQTIQSKEVLREFFAEVGALGLATSPSLMGHILQNVSPTYGAAPPADVGQIWDKIFWKIAERTCRKSEYRNGETLDRWDLAATLAWIARIRADIAGASGLPAPRPAHQPGPGDSQHTNWQQGWDDEDEGYYLLIRTNPALHLKDLERIEAPRVLLRLIEEMSDNKPLRGALWRRYNQLTHDGDNHGSLSTAL